MTNQPYDGFRIERIFGTEPARAYQSNDRVLRLQMADSEADLARSLMKQLRAAEYLLDHTRGHSAKRDFYEAQVVELREELEVRKVLLESHWKAAHTKKLVSGAGN